MKLGILLSEKGYKFPEDKRLEVYLTNTLEEAVMTVPLPLAEFIRFC
jgi:hypothetical protein